MATGLLDSIYKNTLHHDQSQLTSDHSWKLENQSTTISGYNWGPYKNENQYGNRGSQFLIEETLND